MINKIITHFRPHADELIALMFLTRFKEGEEKYPGVSSAKIEFLSTGKLLDGKTFEDFPDTIFLGVGGGPFDEHALIGKQERVEGETCATLVAKDLGIENDPGLKRIMHFVREEDLSVSKVKNSLSVLIKFLHSKYKENFEEIARWAIDGYFAVYENDKKENFKEGDTFEPITIENTFEYLKKQNYGNISWWKKFIDDAISFQDEQYKKAIEDFKNNAQIFNLKNSGGKNIKLAVIESDNEEMNKAGRSRGADALIIFQPGGHVGIFTSHKRNIDLTYTFILLRLAEQHFRGGIKIKDEKVLGREGIVEDIPWYLIHARNAGYNGSLTTKDIEPTKIPKEKIVAIVKEGLVKN